MAELDFMALFLAEKAKAKAERKPKSDQPQQTTKKKMDFSVKQVRTGLCYCNDFLSHEEESSLIQSIDSIEQNKWANLTQRRLLNLGGVPHPSGSWSEDLPEFVEQICSRLVEMDVFKTSPNQILLNEYCNGAGIDHHNDGPLFEPLVCIISLDGDAILNFTEEAQESDKSSSEADQFSVVMRRRSLVVFSDEMYRNYTHGINSIMEEVIDRHVVNIDEADVKQGEMLKRSERRLSLTVRVLSCVKRHVSKFDILNSEEKQEQERREAWWFRSISEK